MCRSLLVLACLAFEGYGRRVKFISEQKQDGSQKEGLKVLKSYSLAELEQSQSNARADASKSSKPVGLLFGSPAFASPSLLPVTGHAHKLALSPASRRAPKLAVQRKSALNGIRSGGHSSGMLMAESAPMWEGSDADFKRALSRLTPIRELPALRKQIRDFDKEMKDALEGGDYVMAARWRSVVCELLEKDPTPLSASLRRSMWAAARGDRYEEAAKYRDQLKALKPFQPEYQLAGWWKVPKGKNPGELRSEFVDLPLRKGEAFVRIEYDEDTLTAFDTNGGVVFTVEVSESELQDQGVHYSKWQKRLEQLGTPFRGEGTVAGRPVPGRMYWMADGLIGFLWSSGRGDEGASAGGKPELVAAGQGKRGRRGNGRGRSRDVSRGGATGIGDVFVSFDKVNRFYAMWLGLE